MKHRLRVRLGLELGPREFAQKGEANRRKGRQIWGFGRRIWGFVFCNHRKAESVLAAITGNRDTECWPLILAMFVFWCCVLVTGTGLSVQGQ